MESKRNYILMGLALVSYLLFVSWQQDYGDQPQQQNYDQAPVAQDETIVDEFPTKPPPPSSLGNVQSVSEPT